jgi:hypothetical protein
MQAIAGNRVDALLVGVRPLTGDTNQSGQLELAEPEPYPLLPDATADMTSDMQHEIVLPRSTTSRPRQRDNHQRGHPPAQAGFRCQSDVELGTSAADLMARSAAVSRRIKTAGTTATTAINTTAKTRTRVVSCSGGGLSESAEFLFRMAAILISHREPAIQKLYRTNMVS